ncbi:MAG TPA: hypothetical protein VNR87_18070 [Flavisolibacter sp.]|nr:hypothetical protein [Flavisolibacter sp.]
MSVADSAVPRNGHDIRNQISSGFTVPLNDVLQEALRRLDGLLTRDNFIVRCEELPQVRGTVEELKQLFSSLIDLIFASASRSRLFLHVGCSAIQLDAHQSVASTMKRYQIRIQTNINPGKGWKDQHQVALGKCEEILSRLDGTLSVNPVTNTGCLFILTVPGKFE